jgi:ribosome modulation factor
MNERPDYRQEGADAYERGIRRDFCPYLTGTAPEELWLMGWDEAKAINDRQMRDEE